MGGFGGVCACEEGVCVVGSVRVFMGGFGGYVCGGCWGGWCGRVSVGVCRGTRQQGV